jgi:hypothetical protein
MAFRGNFKKMHANVKKTNAERDNRCICREFKKWWLYNSV